MPITARVGNALLNIITANITNGTGDEMYKYLPFSGSEIWLGLGVDGYAPDFNGEGCKEPTDIINSTLQEPAYSSYSRIRVGTRGSSDNGYYKAGSEEIVQSDNTTKNKKNFKFPRTPDRPAGTTFPQIKYILVYTSKNASRPIMYGTIDDGAGHSYLAIGSNQVPAIKLHNSVFTITTTA